ncbi:MAG: hypothetical protein IPH16_20475 [Haliscomenobacter sp.]|nr:hypothetical protein [Haliscomenobacter sp.]
MLIPLLLGQGLLYANAAHTPGNMVMNLEAIIGSASVAKGAEVCVPVTVNNFTDILGMEFTITYDPSRLTFKSVKNLNLTGLSETSSFGLPGQGTNQPGTIKVSWLDPNVAGLTIANGTKIFEVCFTAGATDATTAVNLALLPRVIDANENSIDFRLPAGRLRSVPAQALAGGGTGGGGTGGGGTGGGGTGGGTVGTGTFTLDITDTVVTVNQPFCLRVKAGSFRDILGMELTINYNATALTFDSVAKFNLVGLSEAAFGLPGQGTNPLGAIKLSWVDPNVTGISIPDSTVIFQLCFKAKTNNVTTNVTFASNAEIVDKNEDFVPFNGDGGRVIVGTGTGGSTGSGPFTLDLLDASVQSGLEVCLPMTTTNFNNIQGMEFTVTYDPAKLQFKEVKDLNLTGLELGSSFGLPGMGSNPVGTMKVYWNSPDGLGKSVNNGTTLFRVCFTAIGSNTTAVVGFSNTSEVINGNDQVIPLTASPGNVTITGAGGNANLSLVVGSKTVAPNQEVCLDVKVAKFTNILGAEFTLNYTPSLLQFSRVTGFNLSGLAESSFGLPGQGTNQPGAIKVSGWILM